MSYNIFIRSSVYNFGSHGRTIIEEELNKVENPRWHTDDTLNIVIDEDYDMRHIEAIQRARERIWEKQKNE